MKRALPLFVLFALLLSACDRQEAMPTAPEVAPNNSSSLTAKKKKADSKNDGPTISPFLVELNKQIEAEGLNFRIARAEWVTPAASGRAGQVVISKNRGNKQLGFHFVPGDPRRGGRTNITYVVDENDGATDDGLTNAETEPAIRRAMATWEESTRCSKFAIDEKKYPGFDIGFYEALITGGGFPATVPFADVIHAGWLPRTFFDRLAQDGGDFILGVTFTIIFADQSGNPTDINSDGKTDVAFREIYYNDNFDWGINAGVSPYDVETVALHESGHGLSQAHFGKIFLTPKNGKVHFAPFAVMNAAISRQAQKLEGTDNGGHCSIWGSWPNSHSEGEAEAD